TGFFVVLYITLVPYGTSKDLEFDRLSGNCHYDNAPTRWYCYTAPKAIVSLFKCSQNESDS
ncbi:MAG TPA: hypothetical protein VK553_12100, partial [Candidatus Nitrosopolaris rasttigaisensis]|nr:hypothetical protein [Candidatus Nitrosopolaris rasttigaisensis]